ncbi:response regulator [Cyanobacterium stanieri LEGE 03274]|uniref:Protein PatA n=1 Tax=Cyanobacterium stanieri LEGE 03274 TaxID=1828756 RepID=A0ABR9V2L2_9CHRO|nr:response regulator [Cyanobacterium stanieri]MBE9222082.1 response regulator [Cyanobacterium stanieri LEGE 03274]
MDTPPTQNYSVPIKEFVASKQTYLFNTLKKHQFTGELTLSYPGNTEWKFYLNLGRIVYGTGGEHSVRRWRRNLGAYLPEIATDQAFLERELQWIADQREIKICWDYDLLKRWLSLEKISRNQVLAMINAMLMEIFFDLNQVPEIVFRLDPDFDIPLSEQIFLIDSNKIITPAWKSWQQWLGAKMADRSPNKALMIKYSEELKLKCPPKVYQVFTKLINGRNTIRDLAWQLKRDLHQVGKLLLPYIEEGYISLNSIADLPPPVSATTIVQPENTILVACIDDSPAICQTLHSIVKPAGYRFVAITDPIKAIATILASKPDIIFLDLVMPNANGYEICASIRKLSFFRNTPIVILTSNDGMVERMRTKIVGATDFLSKPIQPDEVLNMISKHRP